MGTFGRPSFGSRIKEREEETCICAPVVIGKYETPYFRHSNFATNKFKKLQNCLVIFLACFRFPFICRRQKWPHGMETYVTFGPTQMFCHSRMNKVVAQQILNLLYCKQRNQEEEKMCH